MGVAKVGGGGYIDDESAGARRMGPMSLIRPIGPIDTIALRMGVRYRGRRLLQAHRLEDSGCVRKVIKEMIGVLGEEVFFGMPAGGYCDADEV